MYKVGPFYVYEEARHWNISIISAKMIWREFLKEPEDFSAKTEKDVLKYALGAFLYVPATQYNMIYKSIIGDVKGVRPLAICLEDAVGVNGELEAIENLRLILKNISNESITNKDGIPLIL